MQESPEMLKTISLTKVEYLMLEELAKRVRKRPEQYLKAWIQEQYNKTP